MQIGSDSFYVVTLDLLNSKSIGFDTVSTVEDCGKFQVSPIKGFRLSCQHTPLPPPHTHRYPHTYILTNSSQYRRRRTTSSAQRIERYYCACASLIN